LSKTSTEDTLSLIDPILAAADTKTSPWIRNRYLPDLDLLRELLSIPIGAGEKQESGRVAKALDAWVAHELRRSGFPAGAVWPRTRRPRVLPEDAQAMEGGIEKLSKALADAEADGTRIKPPALRRAIRALETTLPGASNAYILGDFYSKQIDVTISTWRRGPDVLISTKTMFSSYRKNLKNRHEEAVGEVLSLRARHPMATMGYAYLVRRNIFQEDGAYAVLCDILERLRRPGEAFDATMLLIADWDIEIESPKVSSVDQPSELLDAGRFFEDITAFVTDRSPVSEHIEVRRRRGPEPAGGLPTDDTLDDH
jgi:hypothetical protein